MDGLIIDREELSELSLSYKKQGELIETTYGVLIDVLEKVVEGGVSDGRVYENLTTFLGAAKALQGEAVVVLESASGLIDEYLDALAFIDLFTPRG